MNEEILKRLDLLAAKLSTTADHLWSVLVHQSRIEAAQDTIFLVLSLVAAWFLYRWGRWVVATDSDSPVWIVIGILSLVVIVVALICLSSIPTELFNPEYFALHRLLESIK